MIVPQSIHSEELYLCYYLLCVNNKLLSLCRIFEVVRLFSSKFINTYMSAFYIYINISDLILCVWITGIGYIQSSRLSLLSLKFIYMCVIAFNICIRISVFCLLGVGIKASLKQGYVCKCISIIFLKRTYCFFCLCMTAHLQIKWKTDKFCEQKN